MIGVFDSGYGGLTILRALTRELPQYSYMYLGDNARAPYGGRSPEEIYEFTKEGVDYLFKQGSPLVLLACNTASAVALRRLQQEWLPQHYPDRRILGILVPTVEQVTGVPWKNEVPQVSTTQDSMTVGVLATEQTVRSNAYPHEIHKRNPSIQVIQQACPGLVAAIENNKSSEVISLLVASYLQQLEAKTEMGTFPLRAVLLGCTHYELIADIIREQLPPKIELYEQPAIVAKSLGEYLSRHASLAAHITQGPAPVFLTTGDPQSISDHGRRYFGESIAFEQVVLVSLT